MKKFFMGLIFLSALLVSNNVVTAMAVPVVPLHVRIQALNAMDISGLKNELITISQNIENAQKNTTPQNDFRIDGLTLAEWRHLGDEGRKNLHAKDMLERLEQDWFINRAVTNAGIMAYYSGLLILSYYAKDGLIADIPRMWNFIKSISVDISRKG